MASGSTWSAPRMPLPCSAIFRRSRIDEDLRVVESYAGNMTTDQSPDNLSNPWPLLTETITLDVRERQPLDIARKDWAAAWGRVPKFSSNA